jgi:hypothetical protein
MTGTAVVVANQIKGALVLHPIHLRFSSLTLKANVCIAYLDLKIDGLNKDLEHIAGGVLDDQDAAGAGLPCD